jgi:hypothetical protein
MNPLNTIANQKGIEIEHTFASHVDCSNCHTIGEEDEVIAGDNTGDTGMFLINFDFLFELLGFVIVDMDQVGGGKEDKVWFVVGENC